MDLHENTVINMITLMHDGLLKSVISVGFSLLRAVH